MNRCAYVLLDTPKGKELVVAWGATDMAAATALHDRLDQMKCFNKVQMDRILARIQYTGATGHRVGYSLRLAV